MYKRNVLFLILVTLAAALSVACKKGTAIPGELNGTFTAELLNLPNTPAMDVYFNEVWLDSLLPGKGIGGSGHILLPAGKKGTLFFKKKGTDIVLLDTAIVIPTETFVSFRIAFSEDMGLHEFLKESVAVDADSCQVRFSNQLNTTLVPEGMEIEALLYRYNKVTFEFDLVSTLSPYPRNNIYPAIFMLPVHDADGSPSQFYLKYKNVATGEILMDGVWNEFSVVNLVAGRNIISASVQADFGGDLYMFSNEAVVL